MDVRHDARHRPISEHERHMAGDHWRSQCEKAGIVEDATADAWLLDAWLLDGKPGPAGESTREARIVTVTRWALATKLKQGVPMSELTDHFVKLSIAEGLLLKQ